MSKTKKIALVIIFGLVLFLRLYKLGEFPVGLLWDEAALGYNAYSILKTAKDEYGQFLPIIFKSFGDYKPGFYIYLTVPAVAAFDLNEFSVRLPSALAGSLTVLLLALLIFEAMGKKYLNLALIIGLVLAVNPWHINFSRGAWELNLMTFELILGFWLVIKYLNSKKNFWLYASSLVFVLALFTYQSAKALIPALLLGFVFFFRKEVKSVPRKPKAVFLTILGVSFLLFNLLTLGGKGGRLKVMSLFSYPRSTEETAMIKEQDEGSYLAWLGFHSSPIFFTRSVLGRYLNHFSPKFLFFTGDWSNPRNGVAGHGLFYFSEIVLIILGLGALFNRPRKPWENFMLYWLVLAPLPSALTRDIISSVRSFTMVIPLVFIIASGIDSLLKFLANRNIVRRLSLIALIITYALFCLRFLDFYFIHDPQINAQDRLVGYREMVNYIQPLIEKKDKVVITTKYGQPYIFYLFYTKFDPEEYQKIASLKENEYGDVGQVERIGKIEFRKVYWPDDRGIANSLFVDNEFGLPIVDLLGYEDQFVVLKELAFPNGKTSFRIVETK